MTRPEVTGVVLAGGRGRRMGGLDKGLVELDGRPLIGRILDRLNPQVDVVIVNANRNHDRYAAFAHRIVSDEHEGFQGPLAGMLAGLNAAETDLVLMLPCDSPFIPDDLVERMWRALSQEEAEIAVAHDGERMQPVFALMRRSLAASLRGFLEAGDRKIDLWYARHRVALADFSDSPNVFVNINTPEEYRALQGGPKEGTGAETNRPLAPSPTASSQSISPVPLIGFAANSGVGKTTLLCKLIALFKDRGVRVAVLKHAHHTFDIDKPGKDSFVLREAGVTQMLIASARRWALMVEEDAAVDADDYPDLDRLLDHLDRSRLDLILIEGFRRASFPKIELHRSSLDHPLLYPNDPSIIAIASDRPEAIDAPIPVFDLNRPEAIANFILERR